MKSIGYLILQRPEIVLETFEQSIRVRNLVFEYERFRKVFSNFNPTKYLGISREPLFGVPKELQPEFYGVLEPDAQAYIDLLEQQNLSEDDIIFDYDEATKTFNKIIHKQNYDICCVRKESTEINKSFLGFDIGYWGGDHFSLIADTIVMPTWHGPPEEDYYELASRLKSLNENLLFNTFEEANDFRRYYKTKSWAEKESYEGNFSIIQIEKVFNLSINRSS
jgi:hypothetical protein